MSCRLPEPYYEEPGITIYHADCRDVLPHLPRVDLVLTDPPYGIEWHGRGFMKEMLLDHREVSAWDMRPSADLLLMVARAGKECIIWGGNYFADILGAFPGMLVWNKATGDNRFADGEAAWTNVCGTMRIFTHQWCGAFKE